MPIAQPALTNKRSLKIVPGLFLFLASLLTLAFAASPMYVIRPFREQKPAALERALWVLLHDKPLSLILAFVITAVALLLWRRGGWGGQCVVGPAAVSAI